MLLKDENSYVIYQDIVGKNVTVQVEVVVCSKCKKKNLKYIYIMCVQMEIVYTRSKIKYNWKVY